MTARLYSFSDGLMFGFTASVTLWADLTRAEVAMVLAAVFGAALLELAPERPVETKSAEQILDLGVWS